MIKDPKPRRRTHLDGIIRWVCQSSAFAIKEEKRYVLWNTKSNGDDLQGQVIHYNPSLPSREKADRAYTWGRVAD